METLVERFNGLVSELLVDLEGVYPQLKTDIDSFKTEYEVSNSNSRKYFNYFATHILAHSQSITDKDSQAILKLDVLPGVNIKFIFEEAEHSANAEVVWKYLAALALLSSHIFQEAQNEFAKAESPEDIVNQMKAAGFNEEFFAEQSKAFLKILEGSQQQQQQGEGAQSTEEPGDGEPQPQLPPQMENVANQIFGGMIGSLAKEIAQDINPADLNLDPNNPQTLLNNLFSNDNNNLMSLVQNIGGKLQKKLDNGQLNQQALFNEATSIMTNIQSMPGMAEMMNGGGFPGGMPGIDPSMMSGLMSTLMNPGSGRKKDSNTKNLTLLPKNHPKRRKGGK